MENKETNKQSVRNDAPKIFGIVFMTIDHIGLILFPKLIFLRVLGRLALPIFAWYLAQGYIYTSNRKKYALRLGVFAVLAQIPFYLATHEYTLNIFFALLAGLWAINCYQKKKYIALLGVILFSGIIPLDYSFYWVLMILGFYIYQENLLSFLSQAAISLVGLFIYGPIQLWSLMGVALVLYFPSSFPKIQINKYFFYFYYPLHIALIYGLSLLPYFR